MTGILNILAGSIASAIKDGYFNLTTLLLNGNGTNGAQNNTFLDSSSNNFTITRNGNTTQGTFSPFSQTGWSNYFDGTGDCLTYTVTSNKLDPGSAFTIDAWFYGSSTSSSQVLFVYGGGVQGFNSTNGIVWQLYRTSTNQIKFAWYTGGTAFSEITVTSGFVNESWNHIAVGFNGTTTRVWCNGSTTASAATTYSLPTTRNETDICGNLSAAELFTGYASNVRFVSGADLYGVSNTSITVPTAALTTTVSSGTVQLLSCGANNFDDKSTNAFALTVNGNPSAQAFSPFAPTAAYSASTNGGSGYFDGTGDYLSAASNAAFALSGDFSCEFWVYFTGTAQGGGTSQEFITVQVNSGFVIGITTSSIFVARRSVANDLTASVAQTSGQWMHVVACRTGTTMSIFKNGSRVATGTVTSSYAQGAFETNSGNLGYLSGLRLLKGSSAYDPTQTSITVPTAPPTAITNTQLLLNFTNAGITDATAKNVLETVGNAQISTTQSKFGGSSIACTTGTSYLLIPGGQNLEFGTGSFTIEFWWYPVSTSRQALYFGSFGTDYSIAIDYSSVSTNQKIGIWASSTGSSWNLINADPGGNGIGTTTVTQNAWNHIAFVRNGSTWMLFVNGNRDLNLTGISDPIVNRSTYQKGIGVWWSPSVVPNPQTGYIDDLRITKGYARYTSSFTPPTAAFPLS